MFFVPVIASPTLWVLLIYGVASVGPAIFLMRYIYRADRAEPEPPGLLWSLAGKGVLAALAALVLETVGETVLSALVAPSSRWYLPLLAFGVVALSEEGAKLFFLYRRSWNDRNFNYRFDGIVYAVFVSLGFAAFENVKYVMTYGLSVALPRALLAIPAHMGFAVFMGLFYGRARLAADCGHPAAAAAQLWAACLSAVLLHGFYDACAMSSSSRANAVFLCFVAVMYLLVIRLIKKEAASDRPV